jgi:hypothetical protein
LGLWPDAVPFDPSGAEPPVLDSFVSGPAAALTAVTLLAGPAAHASGWACAAAVSVARAWPGGRRVVLADLSLAEPRLHEVLGVDGDEGVVDVVDYGVSAARAMVPIDRRFDFLPAGLYAPDPAATLQSTAWSGIIDELAGRGATLLAYLPADAPGAAAFLERTAVLLLVEPDERDAVTGSLRRPFGIMGVLVPPGSAEDAPEPDEPVVEAAAAGAVVAAARAQAQAAGPGAGRLSDAEFERIRLPKDRAARDTLIADLRERQRAARMAPAVPGAAPPPATVPSAVAMPAGSGEAAVELRLEGAADDVTLDVTDPTVLVPAPARPQVARAREHGHSMMWTLFVVLAVSVLAGAWHFLAGRLLPVAPIAAPVVEAPPAPPPAPPAALALPWVVVVEVHRDLAAAVGRVDALAVAAAPGAFHVAPVELDGTLFYHVMAGPVADSAGAVALRDSLIAGGHKTGATPTDVRATPLSFLVGEYSTQEAADLQLRELARLDMPGYRLQAESADGQPLHRIYVGGFNSAAEADVIRQMLRSAGIRDTLVTRTGSSTQ